MAVAVLLTSLMRMIMPEVEGDDADAEKKDRTSLGFEVAMVLENRSCMKTLYWSLAEKPRSEHGGPDSEVPPSGTPWRSTRSPALFVGMSLNWSADLESTRLFQKMELGA